MNKMLSRLLCNVLGHGAVMTGTPLVHYCPKCERHYAAEMCSMSRAETAAEYTREVNERATLAATTSFQLEC